MSLLLLKKIKMYEYRKGGEEDMTDQQYTLLQLLKMKKEGQGGREKHYRY